jgi:hypothetical protein
VVPNLANPDVVRVEGFPFLEKKTKLTPEGAALKEQMRQDRLIPQEAIVLRTLVRACSDLINQHHHNNFQTFYRHVN